MPHLTGQSRVGKYAFRHGHTYGEAVRYITRARGERRAYRRVAGGDADKGEPLHILAGAIADDLISVEVGGAVEHLLGLGIALQKVNRVPLDVQVKGRRLGGKIW